MKNIKKILLIALLIFTIPALAACNQEKREVSISVISSSYQDGTVRGGGVYKEEETATLIANPSIGKAFVAWIKNNKIVSEEKEFSFKVSTSSSGTYTAVFKSTNPTYLQPFAISAVAKSLKPQESITIDSLSFNFAVGDSTQKVTITTQTDLGFGIYELEQASNIMEFDSEYLLRLRSSYGEQKYTLSSNINYTIGETKVSRLAQESVYLVNLEEKTFTDETKYYQATLSFSDANIQGTIYVWFAPAGYDLIISDIVF